MLEFLKAHQGSLNIIGLNARSIFDKLIKLIPIIHELHNYIFEVIYIQECWLEEI